MEKHNIASHRIPGLIYLAGFALLIFKILAEGSVVSYVHPRFVPFLWAGAVLAVGIILATLLTVRGEHPQKTTWRRPAILLIPLMLGFIVPPNPGVVTDFTYKAQAETNERDDSHMEALPDPVIRARASQRVVLDDNHFYMLMQDMYENPSLYRGKKILFTGMTYRGNKTAPTEFAVVRFLMVCCAADLQTVGIVCSHESAASFANKTWVTIEGEITAKDSDQGPIPFVRVTAVTPTDKPQQEYVYPI